MGDDVRLAARSGGALRLSALCMSHGDRAASVRARRRFLPVLKVARMATEPEKLVTDWTDKPVVAPDEGPKADPAVIYYAGCGVLSIAAFVWMVTRRRRGVYYCY